MNLFEHLPTPALYLGPDTRILHSNKLAMKLLNWNSPPDTFHFHDLIISKDLDKFRTFFSGLSDNVDRGFNTWIIPAAHAQIKSSQSKISVHMRGSCTPDGQRILFINQSFDKTSGCGRYCKYTTILNAQYQLNPGGILLVNADQEMLSYNDEFLRIWDIPLSIQKSGDDAACIECVLHKLINPEEFLDKVYRLYNNPHEISTDEIDLIDGRVLYRHTYPIHQDSEYLGRVWYFLDITNLKKVQKEIEKQQLFQNAILENIRDGIIACNADGEITICNNAGHKLMGMPHETLNASFIDHFKMDGTTRVPPSERPLALAFSGKTVRNQSLIIKTPDGKRRTLRANGQAMYDGRGHNLGAVVSFHDITDLEKIREQLRIMAYHDSLTSLPNRRLFHDLLQHSLKQAHRNNKLVGVLFLDLDNFKEVNDYYGHEEGDKLLITIAKTLRSFIRESDILCRWGGDEFIVGLLDSGSIDGILNVADKICKQAVHCIPEEKAGPRMSVSIGVSIFPDHGIEPDLLIRNADSAMYRAKQSGKNRCILYGQSSSANVWQFDPSLQL